MQRDPAGASTRGTELIEAKEALRANAERLQAMFHHAAVGIAVADMSGRFLEVNQRFAQALGYAPDELLTRTFKDFTHPEDMDRTDENVGRLGRREVDDYVYEKRYVRKDGTVMWGRTSVTLLTSASGEPEQFVGVVEDITDRKEAEDAIVMRRECSRRSTARRDARVEARHQRCSGHRCRED